MITVSEAKLLAEKTLSKKRYKHTVNVEKQALMLAKLYSVDTQKTSLAALLHDICKEMSKEEQLILLSKNVTINGDIIKAPFKVWHGWSAAQFVQEKCGITDPEILWALRSHTTGRVNMTKLDKIIYMADMTSAERDYPEVEILRKELTVNLDTALLLAFEMSIEWLQKGDGPIDQALIDAYKFLRAQLNKGD